MNVKTMLQMAEQNRAKSDGLYEITLSNEPAVKHYDGGRRWLEDGQVVEFIEPEFRGKNAEFSIENQSGQSIWFSQLSKVAMNEDLTASTCSVIKFKGERESPIAHKFRNASEFWNAVRNKQFNVKVIGNGFIVNHTNPKTEKFMKCAANARSEQNVFDYVVDCIKTGRKHEAEGMILRYKIYALTEI